MWRIIAFLVALTQPALAAPEHSFAIDMQIVLTAMKSQPVPVPPHGEKSFYRELDIRADPFGPVKFLRADLPSGHVHAAHVMLFLEITVPGESEGAVHPKKCGLRIFDDDGQGDRVNVRILGCRSATILAPHTTPSHPPSDSVAERYYFESWLPRHRSKNGTPYTHTRELYRDVVHAAAQSIRAKTVKASPLPSIPTIPDSGKPAPRPQPVSPPTRRPSFDALSGI